MTSMTDLISRGFLPCKKEHGFYPEPVTPNSLTPSSYDIDVDRYTISDQAEGSEQFLNEIYD